MHFQLPQYQASGQVHPVASLLYGFGIMVIAAGLGGLYQYFLGLIPLIILNVICVVVAYVLVELSAEAVVKLGAVRNREVAVLLAAAVALSFVVASHAWKYRQDVAGVLYPISVGRWLEIRAEAGWTLSRRGTGISIDGALVYLVWMAEALFFLVVAVRKAWEQSGRPYCEPCQKWTATDQEHIPGIKRAEVESLLRSGRLNEIIFMMGPKDADKMSWISLIGHTCPGCQQTWLSLSEGEKVDGGKKTTSKPIVEHLVLEPRYQQRLTARLGAKPSLLMG